MRAAALAQHQTCSTSLQLTLINYEEEKCVCVRVFFKASRASYVTSGKAISGIHRLKRSGPRSEVTELEDDVDTLLTQLTQFSVFTQQDTECEGEGMFFVGLGHKADHKSL